MLLDRRAKREAAAKKEAKKKNKFNADRLNMSPEALVEAKFKEIAKSVVEQKKDQPPGTPGGTIRRRARTVRRERSKATEKVRARERAGQRENGRARTPQRARAKARTVRKEAARDCDL
jgi:hypothetical protein